MTIEDIQQLIKPDEHRTLELKKTTGELKDGMQSACAFLNTDGGWLIFGITPKSLKILGQDVSDATRQEIAREIAKLEPALDIRTRYIPVPDRSGKQLIVMYFEPSFWGKEPYTYDGVPYYRVESTTRRMPRKMFEERLKAANPDFYAWERKPASGITLQDIDEEHLRGAVSEGVKKNRISSSALTATLPKLLEKLKLVTKSGQPNNAAAFLFGTNQNQYPQFHIRLARFRGNTKSKFDDIQQVEGNFFDLLDAGKSFFFKHLPLRAEIKGFKREEYLEIPAEALREALLNALCHRRWEQYKLSVSIAIYDDRIEIQNPGDFPPQITPEILREEHSSFPYNKIIAEVLFKTTLIEGFGTGTQRIIEYCQEQNVPEPTWQTNGAYVTITFPRPNQVGKEEPTNYPPTTHQLPTNYPSGSPIARLIETIGENRLSVKEIMEMLSLTDRVNFRVNYIAPAMEQGIIAMQYPEQPNHPHQKYYLTEEGRNQLARRK